MENQVHSSSSRKKAGFHRCCSFSLLAAARCHVFLSSFRQFCVHRGSVFQSDAPFLPNRFSQDAIKLNLVNTTGHGAHGTTGSAEAILSLPRFCRTADSIDRRSSELRGHKHTKARVLAANIHPISRVTHVKRSEHPPPPPSTRLDFGAPSCLACCQGLSSRRHGGHINHKKKQLNTTNL